MLRQLLFITIAAQSAEEARGLTLCAQYLDDLNNFVGKPITEGQNNTIKIDGTEVSAEDITKAFAPHFVKSPDPKAHRLLLDILNFVHQRDNKDEQDVHPQLIPKFAGVQTECLRLAKTELGEDYSKWDQKTPINSTFQYAGEAISYNTLLKSILHSKTRGVVYAEDPEASTFGVLEIETLHSALNGGDTATSLEIFTAAHEQASEILDFGYNVQAVEEDSATLEFPAGMLLFKGQKLTLDVLEDLDLHKVEVLNAFGLNVDEGVRLLKEQDKLGDKLDDDEEDEPEIKDESQKKDSPEAKLQRINLRKQEVKKKTDIDYQIERVLGGKEPDAPSPLNIDGIHSELVDKLGLKKTGEVAKAFENLDDFKNKVMSLDKFTKKYTVQNVNLAAATLLTSVLPVIQKLNILGGGKATEDIVTLKKKLANMCALDEEDDKKVTDVLEVVRELHDEYDQEAAAQ